MISRNWWKIWSPRSGLIGGTLLGAIVSLPIYLYGGQPSKYPDHIPYLHNHPTIYCMYVAAHAENIHVARRKGASEQELMEKAKEQPKHLQGYYRDSVAEAFGEWDINARAYDFAQSRRAQCLVDFGLL